MADPKAPSTDPLILNLEEIYALALQRGERDTPAIVKLAKLIEDLKAGRKPT